MIEPAPVALTSPERVATSLMFSPTIAVAVALVTRPGVASSTTVVSFSSVQSPLTALLLASPEKWAIQW